MAPPMFLERLIQPDEPSVVAAPGGGSASRVCVCSGEWERSRVVGQWWVRQ